MTTSRQSLCLDSTIMYLKLNQEDHRKAWEAFRSDLNGTNQFPLIYGSICSISVASMNIALLFKLLWDKVFKKTSE